MDVVLTVLWGMLWFAGLILLIIIVGFVAAVYTAREWEKGDPK